MDIFMFANTKVWTEECFLPKKKKRLRIGTFILCFNP